MIALLLLFCSLCAAQTQVWEPFPDRAKPNCANCSTKGYDILPIANGVWGVTDYGYWSLVIQSRPQHSAYNRFGSSGSTLAVVDAPPSIPMVKALEEILAWTGATTVTDVILSHHHLDHVSASGDITTRWPDANVISHVETKKYIEDFNWGNGNRAVPTVTFKKSMRLNKYGLELDFPFRTHTTGNIIIYHPATKTIMMVDVVFPKVVPFKNLGIAENVPGVFKAYDYILNNYDFDTYVGGHLTVLGDRASVEEGQRYMQDLKAAAEKGMAEVDPVQVLSDLQIFDPTSVNYWNEWAFLDVYIMQMAQVCYDEMKPKWIGVLGGEDVYGLNHCEVMVETLRLD